MYKQQQQQQQQKKTPSEGMDIKQKDLNFKNSLYSQNILKWITIS